MAYCYHTSKLTIPEKVSKFLQTLLMSYYQQSISSNIVLSGSFMYVLDRSKVLPPGQAGGITRKGPAAWPARCLVISAADKGDCSKISLNFQFF